MDKWWTMDEISGQVRVEIQEMFGKDPAVSPYRGKVNVVRDIKESFTDVLLTHVNTYLEGKFITQGIEYGRHVLFRGAQRQSFGNDWNQLESTQWIGKLRVEEVSIFTYLRKNSNDTPVGTLLRTLLSDV